jgi:hypothetical protein
MGPITKELIEIFLLKKFVRSGPLLYIKDMQQIMISISKMLRTVLLVKLTAFEIDLSYAQNAGSILRVSLYAYTGTRCTDILLLIYRNSRN